MEKVYVLTETDSTESRWCYNEVFKNRKDALARLKDLYLEEVVEREGFVLSSVFDEHAGFASAEMVDNLVLSWNVKECELM